MNDTGTLFVVDDDAAVRTSLARMLRADGWRVDTFESAEDFLAGHEAGQPACLVLDLSLPGLDGLELQQRLAADDRMLPIVFLSGHGDIPMTVRAIKAGATDFLTKPVSAEDLLAAVRKAIAEGESARQASAQRAELGQRLALLSQREREVLRGLVKGRLNKQIAADLGIVEQTVKFHRARIMERMQARTIAQLMHIAARLGIAG